MPFANKEDHRESVWEIILRITNTQRISKKNTPANADGRQLSSDQLITKYQEKMKVDEAKEIQQVINYLIRTSSFKN
jgi:hypothetical protein